MEIAFPKKLNFLIDQPARSGIYAIVNLTNNKMYIGSAVNLYRRCRDHKSSLKINKHHSILLQRSWNLHGEENFVFLIIEYIEKQQLLDRETFWLKLLNVCDSKFGYNTLVVAGSRFGMKNSNEHNEKISETLKAKELKRSEETKAKMSWSKLGHKVSQETRDKIGNSQKGKRISQETRIKLSIAGKGNLNSRGKGKVFTCENGTKCKCEKCREIRNNYARNYRQKQIGISLRW